MSTENNKMLLRRFYIALDTPDFQAIHGMLADDYVDHALPPGLPPNRASFKHIIAQFHQAFHGLTQEIEDLIGEGDRVVARSTIRGTHRGEFFGIPATGKAVSLAQIHIARIADGKIAEHWANEDDLGLMQRLGVIPRSP